MSYLISNAAMIPNEGTFHYRIIQAADAASWLWKHSQNAESYVGYPQTAEHLESLCAPLKVALNRAKCSMREGDQALVCRLAYRVENPATKGQPQPEDWEYGILTACGVNGYHCETCANAMGENCPEFFK